MSLARLILAAALLAFGVASAQAQVPNFQGHVYDSHRNPIVGATVSIGPSGRSSKQTGSTGFFSIEPAPSVKLGTPITLQIQKDGYQPFSNQMEYTGVSQVIALAADGSTHRPAPARPTTLPAVQKQSPVAGANGVVPPPLWPASGDVLIDSVQNRLNGLPSDATDAQTTSILRGLFDAPIFTSIGEELPEDAMYRFCRTERVLTYYQLGFASPDERSAVSTASQNLIYLQDIFADLWGPAFSAKEHCNRFGARLKSEYQSNLAQRLKERSALDGVKAQRVIDSMLRTLASVGLSSHAPAAPAMPPQGTEGDGGIPPTVTTAVVKVNSARLNDWLDQGDKGGNQYWLKSIWLRIDTDERQIAKDLPFDSEVPQVDQAFTLTKGKHTFRYRLEFDVRHFNKHEQFTSERLGEFDVDQDLTLTPFLTVRADEIKQWMLLRNSDPVPTRTTP